MPLAYGAADVDLITGTETAPNITQSETYTTANPDNPNQIVVAYNDSRGRNANPINISGASVSTEAAPHLHASPRPTVKVHSTIPGATRSFCTTSPSGTWFTVWLDSACGGQGLGGTSPPLPWIRIAGPISCVFNEVGATVSLAGPRTTRPPRSLGGCIFPGTTSISGRALSWKPSPLMAAPHGTPRSQ